MVGLEHYQQQVEVEYTKSQLSCGAVSMPPEYLSCKICGRRLFKNLQLFHEPILRSMYILQYSVSNPFPSILYYNYGEVKTQNWIKSMNNIIIVSVLKVAMLST